MRLSRWRPVCPECAYSLRRAASSRCPECGAAYPASPRVFRRWASRRLRWDRAERGSLFVAYLGTVLSILVCPCRAARRIAIPDRWGRAFRWAAGHVALLALAATLLCNDRLFSEWLWHRYRPDPFYSHPMFFMHNDAPAGQVLIWFTTSFCAWAVVFAAPPTLGILLSCGLPRQHRAWKRTSAKWSLYATVSMAPCLVGWYTLHPQPIFRYPSSLTIYGLGPFPDLPLLLAGLTYAPWWAAGLCRNVYGQPLLPGSAHRMRWPLRMAVFMVLFVSVWYLLVAIVYPLGALKELL